MRQSLTGWIRTAFFPLRARRRRLAFQGGIERLEPRQLLTVSLAPITPVDLAAGKTEYLPLTAVDSGQSPVSFTVSSSDPGVSASIVAGGRSIRMNVSGVDSATQPFSGDLTFRLFESLAPATTSRIINLVNSGFYNGLIFHRIIDGFVAQGGDPAGTGSGGSGVKTSDEFNKALTFSSTGLLAMANSGNDTQDSQFFITDIGLTLNQLPEHLNFRHTIFGVLTSGFDTFNKLMGTPTGTNNRPLTNVTINSAVVFTDTQDGVLQVTAPQGFTGTSNITVTATGGQSQTAQTSFSLNVVADTVNDAAFLGPVTSLTTTQGAPVSFNVQGFDLENDALTFVVRDPAQFSNTTIVAPPSHVTVGITVNQANGATPASATITLTPNSGFTGTVNLLIGVRDQTNRLGTSGTLDSRSNFDTQQITLTVTPANVGTSVTATEFAVGLTAGSGPALIAAGGDGNMWFTEFNGSRIGRITPAGVITEFSTGITPAANLYGITAGPDGNIWFTENATDKIGRITPDGVVTEFSAGITPGSGLAYITTGPDGNLWFTERTGNRIGRITTGGVVTEFSTGISPGAGPLSITAGPDGNLWFTEFDLNRIGRITPQGVVTEFSAGITAGALPYGITAGPDGNVWFAENADRIGRITPAGVVTEFSAGITQGSTPLNITRGSDGNLWFTDVYDRIGRITPAGVVTEFSTGISAESTPLGIAPGPDGNLWFAEYGLHRIGRLGQNQVTINAPVSTVGATASVTLTVTSTTGGVPGGSATLALQGGLSQTQPLVNGAATFTLTGLTAGAYPLTGSYNTTAGLGLLVVNSAPGLTVAALGSPAVQTSVFFLGSDLQIRQQRFDANHNLIAPASLVQPGAAGSALAAVTLPGGGQMLFVLGGDQQVYAARFDAAGTLSSGFALTQAAAVKSINTTTDGSGNPLLLVKGLDDQVYFQRFDAVGNLSNGYALSSGGAVKNLSASGPILFVQGLDNQLYRNVFNGTAWNGYSLPSAGAVKSFNFSTGLLLGIGIDDQLYGQRIDAQGGSGGWFLTAAGAITSVTQELYSGLNVAFVMGIDNQVYEQKFDASGVSLGYTVTVPGAVRSITGGKLNGVAPALYVVDSTGQISVLSFDANGNPLGDYVPTNSGAVGSG